MASPGARYSPGEAAQLFGVERFATPPGELAERLARVRGVVLDWDGVGGTGLKGPDAPSSFNEIDCMGLNLLRFVLWRRGGRGGIPPLAVVSGALDTAAQAFADRENLSGLYMGFLDKRLALDHLCRAHGLSPSEFLFIFDDVIDFGMAERCGARFLVARPAQPLVEAFVRRNRLCDYVVREPGGTGAVREACEVALALLGEDEAAFRARGWYDPEYQRYLTERKSLPPVPRYAVDGGEVVVRSVVQSGQ